MSDNQQSPPQAKEKRVPSLDGLRAISILLVIFAHIAYFSLRVPLTLKTLLETFCFGKMGVLIFFVISGFLITTLLLKEKSSVTSDIDIRKFYIRRALRILPVNYLYILVIFLINQPFHLGIKNPFFIPALTYTTNFIILPAFVLGHLWSLSIEEQFYLFWTWAMRLPIKKIVSAALIIICITPFINVINYFNKPLGVFLLEPFLNYAPCLMIGCLLSISKFMRPDLWKLPILQNGALRLLSIFITWLMFYFAQNAILGFITLPFGNIIASLGAAFFIASSIVSKNTLTYKILNHPIMVYIGVLSYSLYIWQQLFVAAEPMYWWPHFPLNLLLIFVAAMLSYHLWEKMFLRMKDKFTPTPSA